MAAKAGFHGLALTAALALASSGILAAGAMAQDESAEQTATQEESGSAASPGKSDLDQTALRGATVDQTPRPTLTSTRSVALPKILGSHR